MPVFNIFDALHCSGSIGKVCVPDIPDEFIILTAVPLAVYQQCQSVLKSELIVASGILCLTFEFICKCAHFHGAKTLNRIIQHYRHRLSSNRLHRV